MPASVLPPSRLRTLFAASLCALPIILTGCGASGGSTGGSGTGSTPIPSATLSTTALTFPATATGTTATQTVTLSNTGTATLSNIAVTTTGTSFSAISSCSSTLPAGASCPITVTFSSTAAGSASGILSLSDNAAGTPQTVTLNGLGFIASASLSSTSLAFAATATGTSAPTQTVTLSNTGAGPLSNIAIATTGAAFAATTTCPATLALGGTCAITVTFSAIAIGNGNGILSVSDVAASGPQTATLTGSGFTPACTPSPAPVVTAPTPAPTGTLAGAALNVTVLAGQTPIVGSSVQLYAAGVTGLGSAPTPLLATPVLTSATGAVTIPAGYTCPQTNSQLYAVARGGAVPNNDHNSNIALMTALGACNQVSSGAAVTINEVTTVAGAYALSQFMATGGAIGATASNVTGIANAFATAASLASPALGTSPGTTFPANGVAPTARLYSLANALHYCAISNVVTSLCAALFNVSPNAAGTIPTNTLDAVFNISRNPGKNVAELYFASVAIPSTFQPALTAAPTDWTMFSTFSGGGMNSPSGLGIDSVGNVRVANYFNVASAFSPLGAPLYANGITGDGLDNSYGLAVDASDNAWIPNEQSPYSINGGIGSVTLLNLAGTAVAGSNGYFAGGLNYPLAIAIDPNTTAWVVDYGNSHLTLLSAAGAPLSGTSGYTTSLFAFPVAVALDSNHYGYIANESSSTITRVAPDGSSFLNYNCCNGASAVAVDQQNNIWGANFYGASISQINSCGSVLSSNYKSGGLTAQVGYTGNSTVDHPQSIAIDGSGNVWIANFRQPYFSELAGATATTPGLQLSPSPGYGADAALLEAYALAIDPSGNIWITNFGSNTITEFVGMAVPVRTPLLGTPRIP